MLNLALSEAVPPLRATRRLVACSRMQPTCTVRVPVIQRYVYLHLSSARRRRPDQTREGVTWVREPVTCLRLGTPGTSSSRKAPALARPEPSQACPENCGERTAFVATTIFARRHCSTHKGYLLARQS